MNGEQYVMDIIVSGKFAQKNKRKQKNRRKKERARHD